MTRLVSITLLALAAMLAGCNSKKNIEAIPEPKVIGDTVTMATNSPQIAALTVETVGKEKPAFVPLTARLMWDEDATVRVFTPFAGIIRKLLVEVNQRVARGMPLAEIQSAEFGQAQAEARKAASDFRRAERALT